MTGIRVFLLDDHEIVRSGLRTLLVGAGMEVVGESGSARSAVGDILVARPDVAVLDVRLPDGSGIDVCKELGKVAPDVRVLMLTSFNDDTEALFDAVEAGTRGYLLKDVKNVDLVGAIEAIAEGKSLIDPALTARLLERIRRRDAQPSTSHNLTANEHAVLSHLAAGLTNREIGQRLYLSERTVRGHVSRLLAKLGVTSRTQAAVIAASMRDDGSPP